METLTFTIPSWDKREDLTLFFSRIAEEALVFGLQIPEESGEVIVVTPKNSNVLSWGICDAFYDTCERYVWYFAKQKHRECKILFLKEG